MEKEKVFKYDESGVLYARRHEVNFVYVDLDTGELMQFGINHTKDIWNGRWQGMFPNRRMKTMGVQEYVDFCIKPEKK